MRANGLTGRDFGAGVVSYASYGNLPSPTNWAKEHLFVALAGTTEATATSQIQVNLLDRNGVESRRLNGGQEGMRKKRRHDGPTWAMGRIAGNDSKKLHSLMFRVWGGVSHMM